MDIEDAIFHIAGGFALGFAVAGLIFN